jgi:5-methylcytosine-specific restriction enzyme A
MPWKPPRHRPNVHAKESRPTAHRRHYDRRHRKQREEELQAHPLCVYCLARGKVVAAEVIDHIVAMARGGDAYAPENRQPLCSDCNAIKAATIDKGLPNKNPDFGPLPLSHHSHVPPGGMGEVLSLEPGVP